MAVRRNHSAFGLSSLLLLAFAVTPALGAARGRGDKALPSTVVRPSGAGLCGVVFQAGSPC